MEEDENLSSVCEDGTDVSGGDVATEKILKFSIYQFFMFAQYWTPVPMVQPPNLVILYDMGNGDQKSFTGRDAKTVMSA